MRPPIIAFACMLAVLTGCGSDDPAPPRTVTAPPRTVATTPAPAPATPALCADGIRAQVTGRVTAEGATELSGLVASRGHRGVLWAHNDSGDRPRLFALRSDGELIREVPVTGATGTDWEDIAATGDALLVGDIGDNARGRSAIEVDRIAEPDPAGAEAAQAQPLTLRYPDGPHDAEALLSDPTDGSLVIVTKELDGAAGVYAAPAGGGTLRRSGTLDLGLLQLVTAGDVSADGRTVALRSYNRLYVWRRAKGEPLTRTLRGRPCSPAVDMSAEGQGESLALGADGRTATTVPEGDRPALRTYGVRR